MKTLSDRFREWYDYERDCNLKSLDMLASVPDDRRGEPGFQKAIDRMAHLATARRRWLVRLGPIIKVPALHPQSTRLADLPKLVEDTETARVNYLETWHDHELDREVEWEAADGKRYRWTVEGILTQVSNHAPYHRGQIAHLVAALGGKAVDTDYILWCKLAPLASVNF